MLNQGMMNEKDKCPRCGAALPADAPEGLCPRCLGALNLETETNVSGAETGAWVPPPVSELRPLFPQIELFELVGRGGMGAVYRACQKGLDRIVALKILPPGIGSEPAFAERFAQEAKAMARLNHPGIVTVHDFGRAGGLFYFLMEFVDGVSLRQLMNAGRVSPREALAIVPQICDALQYAHDQGIVHRDIKPENILLDRRGRVKVADFGLAKLVGTANEPAAGMGSSGGSASVTEAGKVMGTPNYMAPEQMERPAEVDHRADIFALGVVFYQMLTGELPGPQLEPPSKKVRIDVRLDEVVLQALAREPARRYQKASEVKTAVEAITHGPAPAGGKKEPGTEGRPPASLDQPTRSARFWSAPALWRFRVRSQGTEKRQRTAAVQNASAAGTAGMTGGHPRRIFAGLSLSVLALLALGILLMVWERQRATRIARVPATPQVVATPAHTGDIGVYLGPYVGTVETSNSVVFSISQNLVQKVIPKFDAGESLVVNAYDPNGNKFGHGFLDGVDNRIDVDTGTLKCKARLVPERANLMIPGLSVNISMLLEVKHGVLLVPANAINRDPQSAFVWVIQADQTVTRRRVRVGTIEDQFENKEHQDQATLQQMSEGRRRDGEPQEALGPWAEVQTGLSHGDLVVLSGFNDLAEGRRVKYKAR